MKLLLSAALVLTLMGCLKTKTPTECKEIILYPACVDPYLTTNCKWSGPNNSGSANPSNCTSQSRSVWSETTGWICVPGETRCGIPFTLPDGTPAIIICHP